VQNRSECGVAAILSAAVHNESKAARCSGFEGQRFALCH
jgi:hypothetical protein